MPRLAPLLLLPWLAAAVEVHAADPVTVYRCTDAQGRLSLRDTPCKAGESQQTRTMQRPQDPPPRPAPPPATTTAPPLRVIERTVVRSAPRPLYECTRPDGERYTSESDAGNPRFVPLWTLGYPVLPVRPLPRGGVSGRVDFGGGDVRGSVRFGDPLLRPHPPAYPVAAYPAGTWVRDACYALPPQEVCDRLRDQRWTLDRRYNSALQSERERITLEQRGIDARLTNDCDS